MIYIIFVVLLVVCSPVSYFAWKILSFYYRYGFIYVDNQILPVRLRNAAYQVDYLSEVYTVTQVFQNNMLEPYFIKMKERGLDVNLMVEVLRNTDISMQADIRYEENKRAAGKAEFGYTGTQLPSRNVILLNASHMKEQKMSAQVTAGLIMHELVHHYLKKDEGSYWGKGYVGTHGHPIWKIIGV